MFYKDPSDFRQCKFSIIFASSFQDDILLKDIIFFILSLGTSVKVVDSMGESFLSFRIPQQML